MKKAIYFIIGIAIAGGVYYGYDKAFNKANMSIWSLVPEHALLVYESNNAINAYNQIIDSKVGSTILGLPQFSVYNNEIKSIDSVFKGSGLLQTLVSGKFLISVHLISQNEFGLNYYLNLNDNSQKEVFSRLIENFRSNKNTTLNSRKYQNKVIYELVNADVNETFSYYVEDNIVAGSFTPFLVEDVIRRSEEEISGFYDTYSELYEMPKLSNDLGNVYINTHRLDYVAKALKNNILNILKLGDASFLDFNLDNHGVYLNGFTSNQGNDKLLSIFNGQRPVSSNLKYLIPNSSSSSVQIGFNDPANFFNQLQVFATADKNYQKELESYLNKYSKNSLNEDWVSNDLGLVDLDRNRGQLFFVNTSDINEALNELNTFGEQVAQANGDSVYVEEFSTYEIREIEVKDYIKYTFWPFIENWEGTYYTTIENYLVFSNTIANLKSLIDDLNNEDTWGRSVTYNKFYDKSLEEFNLSVIINTERYLEQLKPSLNVSWRKFIANNQDVLSNFNLMSVQLSRLDNDFYTSVIIGHQEQQKQTKENIQPELEVQFATSINTKPFVVKNHISNLKEVLVQDSLNQLHLISNDGDILWSKLIESGVVGDIVQVDFYNNNKLQYFFTTANKLHIIDRNGNYVEGYPIEVDSPISFSNVIDYDNSKNYRLLTANERGDIYLFSKTGKLLDGWMPNAQGGALVSTPFHIRVRKKDCFVTVRTDGTVQLINRRGELMNGFPLELEGRLNAGVNVKIGSDENTTIFSTITKSGLLIKFNMLGRIVETNQLYKPNKDSDFKIVSDALNKSYIVVRKDLNRVVVLNETGQELFAKDYLDAQEMLIQYYDFSASNKLYAITDKSQGFTYLYDKAGKLINARPINSDHEVGIIFSEVRDYLKIYSTAENQFRILELN